MTNQEIRDELLSLQNTLGDGHASLQWHSVVGSAGNGKGMGLFLISADGKSRLEVPLEAVATPQQRLHTHDVPGHIIGTDDFTFKHLRIPLAVVPLVVAAKAPPRPLSTVWSGGFATGYLPAAMVTPCSER